MLKTYIVEDEAKAVKLLKKHIAQIPYLDLVGAERSALSALHFLENSSIDVLFLDINMPEMSGLELYKKLNNPPAVIFTTAHPEFAVEGFDLEAIDYLVKPIQFSRFKKACERVLKRQNVKEKSTEAISENFLDIVYIKSGTSLHKLSWREILYLEKDENYVIYHTKEKRILSRQTLHDLEEIFPKYFVRIHKTYVISLLHIQQVERERVLINSTSLPIGRTYRSAFLEQIG